MLQVQYAVEILTTCNLYGSKSVSGLILKKSEPFENVDESINFDVPDIKEVCNPVLSCADENFVPPFDDLC